jgi:hypothetical protein
LPKGEIITRTLVVNDSESIFTREERISYNKHNGGGGFGRATYEGHSAFYGCLQTNLIPADTTSILEVIRFKKDVDIEKYQVVLGNWRLQEEKEFAFLGGFNSLTHLSDEAIERNKTLMDACEKEDANKECITLIDNFLCEQFSIDVAEEDTYRYKISACYAEFIKEQGIAGIIYPSVKSNGAGLNIVVFPLQIDIGLLKLEEAFLVNYHKRGSKSINEYKMRALNDSGTLRWNEIYNGGWDPNVKNYYTGHTDINPLDNSPVIDLNQPR